MSMPYLERSKLGRASVGDKGAELMAVAEAGAGAGAACSNDMGGLEEA